MDYAYKNAKNQIIMYIFLEESRKKEELLINKIQLYLSFIKDKDLKNYLKKMIKSSRKHMDLCTEMMIKLNLQ
ncbi:MAG: hypothetical protein N4A57_08490 [Anaeromicrobium sp.]|jgi:hypothetical protein|uniref:hypothetical protein n=1 Tax=Anaeromicrobium sp. TaxID=1929132 RepID=UPI0025E8BD8F|nr:hypothetical protein [Anaeromicrobium sp.]MCT4594290.1 hypothetical protein [Anaeromicrobium sp.]